jgi:hypothetical protein
MRSRPLPEGLALILRILAGDVEALGEAQRLVGLEAADIVALAELYVLQVMLYRGASPRRVLGVGSGAERSEIRRHLGWLMSWLHPDKNASHLRTVFVHRVLDAWHQINNGIVEDELRLPSTGTRRRRRSFIPWISGPFEPIARTGFMDFWRKRMRLWGVGLLLVSSVPASDDLRSGRAVGSDSSVVAAPSSVTVRGSFKEADNPLS